MLKNSARAFLEHVDLKRCLKYSLKVSEKL
jgi:hypothetical protein